MDDDMGELDEHGRARLLHPGDPRRPTARRVHRCGRAGGVVVDHVRPGRRRQPQGLRVLPVGQPDPVRARSAGGLARGGAPRPGVRQRPRRRGQHPATARPGPAHPARQRRVRRHVPADLQGVGPARLPVVGGRPDRCRRPRRRLARRRRDGVARDADQPAAHLLRHRGDRRGRPRATGRSSWWTTRSPRPTSSSR